jgi:arsenate reductase
MGLKIYHNARCSKSRQTLALMEAAGATFDIVAYLETPLTQDELRSLRDQLGVETRDMMRRGEAIYKQLLLAKETDDEKLLAAMAAHPILLERPVVSNGRKAILGRPPENVKTLF